MGNYFGYERISTKEERGMQHFSRQDAALKKYAAKHKIDYVRIYGDDSSGKDFIRREWIQLEKALHEGDTIVFKDLSRFTRQAEEGYQKYLDLIGKGITLVFIDNPTVCSDYITKLIDTADHQNIVTRTAMEGIVKLMLIVELDRAEQERLQLIQRTRDGIAASHKKQGRNPGSLDKMSPKLRNDIFLYLHDRSITQSSLMKKYSISRNTLKKYIAIIQAEQDQQLPGQMKLF